MHRDIKSLNVFLDDDMVAKVADFGFTTNDKIRTDPAGTPQWMAPEILNIVVCDHVYECVCASKYLSGCMNIALNQTQNIGNRWVDEASMIAPQMFTPMGLCYGSFSTAKFPMQTSASTK